MGEVSKPTDVAERLRLLQARMSLTIQEMSERCGLPKRSLENYMNLKDPQRPGVDALIGIADGLGVSVDWLVGRSENPTASEFSKEDYAVFCQSVVLHVLDRIIDALKDAPGEAVDTSERRIMGYSSFEIATVAMLDFVAIVDLQSGHPSRPKNYFKKDFSTLSDMATEDLGKRSIQDLATRKP
ncbi:MAG: helix-turn-helix domain-containing protein [Gemmobacter sp.]